MFIFLKEKVVLWTLFFYLFIMIKIDLQICSHRKDWANHWYKVKCIIMKMRYRFFQSNLLCHGILNLLLVMMVLFCGSNFLLGKWKYHFVAFLFSALLFCLNCVGVEIIVVFTWLPYRLPSLQQLLLFCYIPTFQWLSSLLWLLVMQVTWFTCAHFVILLSSEFVLICKHLCSRGSPCLVSEADSCKATCSGEIKMESEISWQL